MVSQAIDYVSNYCLNSENVQQADIKEELEDMLDEEFDTICEDDSPSGVYINLPNAFTDVFLCPLCIFQMLHKYYLSSFKYLGKEIWKHLF